MDYFRNRVEFSGLGLLFHMLNYGSDILAAWGVGIVLVITIFGFGIIPGITTGYEETHFSKAFNYVKSPTTVYIEYKVHGQLRKIEYNDIDTYNNIDKCILKIVTCYNYYGGCIGNSIELVRK